MVDVGRDTTPDFSAGSPNIPPTERLIATRRRLTPASEMLVGKGDLLAHRDIRFDRPFEDQNHVTMARHARGLRQLVETLDRLRGQLHRDGAGFS